MKTAKEWRKKFDDYSNPNLDMSYYTWVEKVINEARKEAIEECAEQVVRVNHSELLCSKESILSLINELK